MDTVGVPMPFGSPTMTIEAPSHRGRTGAESQGSEPSTSPPAPASSETSYNPLPVATAAGINDRKTVITPPGQQGGAPDPTTVPTSVIVAETGVGNCR